MRKLWRCACGISGWRTKLCARGLRCGFGGSNAAASCSTGAASFSAFLSANCLFQLRKIACRLPFAAKFFADAILVHIVAVLQVIPNPISDSRAPVQFDNMEAFIRGCLFRLVDCRGYLLRHRRVNDFKALRRRVKSFRKVRRNRAPSSWRYTLMLMGVP